MASVAEGLLVINGKTIPDTEVLIMWAMATRSAPSTNVHLHEILENTISDLSLRTLINRSIDRGLVKRSKVTASVGGIIASRVVWYPLPEVAELLRHPDVQPVFQVKLAERKRKLSEKKGDV